MALLPRLGRLFTPPAPTACLEIAGDRVTGITIGRGRGVTAVVTEELAEGALVPSANAANLVDPEAVTETVARVLRRLPGNPTRVALVLPDSAAKVSLMTFEQIPARAADLDKLVRWQARKTAPFRIEDAQVTYVPGRPAEGGGREFVVTLMRRDVVEEYEEVCARAGGHAGLIDLASFSLVNTILATGAGGDADCLLVHVAHGYSTIAVVRAGHLLLFRNRPAEGDGNLADLVHQTTMYYEDRLQGAGFGRVFLAASAARTTSDDASTLRRSLQSRLDREVEPIDLGEDGGSGQGAALPDLVAAPLGLLLRERHATETGA
jgi:type IV pilus assembly protein PilM